MKSPLRHIPSILLVLFIAGCAEQPIHPGKAPAPVPDDTSPAMVRPAIVDEVERLLDMAERSRDSATANTARLDALAELLQRGDGQQARELLDILDRTRLSPRQQVRHALLGARLELQEQRPNEALERLQALPADEGRTEAALQIDLSLVRAGALDALGRHLDSAHERTLIHPWLRDDSRREENATALFASLAATDMPTLERAIADATREDWRGWLELAVVVRDIRPGPRAQLAALARWEQRYATLAPLRSATDMLPTVRGRIRQPARVALLLPLSGDAAAAGLAVLHGYLVEYLQQLNTGEAPPSFAVVDSAAAPGGFAAAYAATVADGAEFVIGPLLKEDLGAFGPAQPASVPTLALNFSDTPPPPDGHLYAFGLDASDEAEQLARAAQVRGFRHVVVLSDGSPLSQRQVQRFREHWRTSSPAGGDIIDTLTLGDLNVFRRELEQMLLIQGNQQRVSALTQLLGRGLVTETRRRQDLDLFAMFANPTAARSLRPLVSFLYAGDLPVWATSQSHSAQSEQRRDRDLEAVRFLDAPWFAPPEQRLREALGEDATPGATQRFAALGVDACRLQSRTDLLEWVNTLGLSGATGELVLDDRHRLHRRLSWYTFKGGVAVAEDSRVALVPPDHTKSPSTEGEAPWSMDEASKTVPQP